MSIVEAIIVSHWSTLSAAMLNLKHDVTLLQFTVYWSAHCSTLHIVLQCIVYFTPLHCTVYCTTLCTIHYALCSPEGQAQTGAGSSVRGRSVAHVQHLCWVFSLHFLDLDKDNLNPAGKEHQSLSTKV